MLLQPIIPVNIINSMHIGLDKLKVDFQANLCVYSRRRSCIVAGRFGIVAEGFHIVAEGFRIVSALFL